MSRRSDPQSANRFFQRGQEFEPFKLMIYFIMSLLVLGFILSAVTYFESQRLAVSQTRFFDSLKSAIEGSNVITAEKPLEVRNLLLDAGELTSREAARRSGLESADCVNLYARRGTAYTISPDLKVARIAQRVETTVYIYCKIPEATDLTAGSCKTVCSIFFAITPKQWEAQAAPPPPATPPGTTPPIPPSP